MKGFSLGGWIVVIADVRHLRRGPGPAARRGGFELPPGRDQGRPPRPSTTRMEAAKPEIMKRQLDLLQDRYDLSDRPAVGVTMSRGKPVQDGVRAKLPPQRELGDTRGDDPR